MKEMTKYSRVAGYLEKLFDMLNADLFDGELERPIITLIPSSRSYGHYVPAPIWSIRDECKHELNIATATLNRPIEYTIADGSRMPTGFGRLIFTHASLNPLKIRQYSLRALPRLSKNQLCQNCKAPVSRQFSCDFSSSLTQMGWRPSR